MDFNRRRDDPLGQILVLHLFHVFLCFLFSC